MDVDYYVNYLKSVSIVLLRLLKNSFACFLANIFFCPCSEIPERLVATLKEDVEISTARPTLRKPEPYWCGGLCLEGVDATTLKLQLGWNTEAPGYAYW